MSLLVWSFLLGNEWGLKGRERESSDAKFGSICFSCLGFFVFCVCGFIKHININKFCREKHLFFFLARKRSTSRKNTRGLSKYFHFCTIRSFCLHEPDFLISCRWTGLWPWKRKEFRPEIGKCPTNQRKARKALSVLRNCPSACKRSRLLSALLPLLATWLPWGICHLSATLDTSYQHPPPSTHLPASHLDIHTHPAWLQPWDKIWWPRDPPRD